MRKTRNKIIRTLRRVDYLKEILQRHKTEYMKILQIITNRNLKNKRGIGFWSLTRVIFPVIEAVADTLGITTQKLLTEKLNVPFGLLVWEMYRHSLMHTDELRYAVYKSKTISWSIELGNEGSGHSVSKKTKSTPTIIRLSLPKLYADLEAVLVKEISNNDKTMIDVQVGSHFPIANNDALIRELEEIYGNY